MSNTVEYHHAQYIESIQAVSQSMKVAAKMADAYLNAVQNASGSNSLVNGISDDSDVPTNNIKKPRKSKATVADEEPVETGKRKREKKPKDPNAPKRPASSFILYQNEVRKELKDRHPEISTADLRKVIAEQWAKMTAEEKEPYTKQASDAKQTYSDAKAAYDARSPDEVAAANAAVADAAASKKPRQSKPKADKPEQKPVSIKKPVQSPPSASEEESDEEFDDEKKSSDEDEEEDEEEEEAPPPKKAKNSSSKEKEKEREKEKKKKNRP